MQTPEPPSSPLSRRDFLTKGLGYGTAILAGAPLLGLAAEDMSGMHHHH